MAQRGAHPPIVAFRTSVPACVVFHSPCFFSLSDTVCCVQPMFLMVQSRAELVWDRFTHGFSRGGLGAARARAASAVALLLRSWR